MRGMAWRLARAKVKTAGTLMRGKINNFIGLFFYFIVFFVFSLIIEIIKPLEPLKNQGIQRKQQHETVNFERMSETEKTEVAVSARSTRIFSRTILAKT